MSHPRACAATSDRLRRPATAPRPTSREGEASGWRAGASRVPFAAPRRTGGQGAFGSPARQRTTAQISVASGTRATRAGRASQQQWRTGRTLQLRAARAQPASRKYATALTACACYRAFPRQPCHHMQMAAPQVDAAQLLATARGERDAQRQRTLALLGRLKIANETGLLLEPWRAGMLEHFAGELGFWYLRMRFLPHDWANLPIIAFCARGLLELRVWAAYCTKSPENARRFYGDKFRDGTDFYDALKRLVAPFPDAPSLIDQIERAKLELAALAASVGSVPPDDAHTRVTYAAEEIGFGDTFRNANKVLSKIAHPSAMIVLNYFTPENSTSIDGIASFAKVIGFWNEAEAWRAIGDFLDTTLSTSAAAPGA